MTDHDAGYHQMRAGGSTPQEVFRQAVADGLGRLDTLRVIRSVFGLGLLDAKEVALEVTGSPAVLAAWREDRRRAESEAASRGSEYAGPVDASMLRSLTTLEDYFHRKITSKASSRRPSSREHWEEQRAMVEGRLRQGDELWIWQDGEGFGSCGGLALVRETQIVYAWLHRFS